MNNNILKAFNIKDKNIKFSKNFTSHITVKGVQVLCLHATLDIRKLDYCPKCGCINENYSIIKNGHKTVNIKLPPISNQPTILKLKKPRFLCKNCNKSTCAQTSIVDPNHTISHNTRYTACLEAKHKQSIKDIAFRLNIASSTIGKYLRKWSEYAPVTPKTLPTHLSFDEFKSVKEVRGKMSFIYIDADTGKILDILSNRTLSFLKSYFYRFPDDIRNKVETITIDMYAPYIELIKACFPKATIITDRFHIVQHLNRALNSTRVETMKHNSKYQTKYKRYWKLILKNNTDLEMSKYKYFPCYKQQMCESLIVNDLISKDDVLKETYYLVQKFRKAINNKDIVMFKQLLSNDYKNISKPLKRVVETFRKQEPYILASFIYPYSNGRLEGINNLIKVIKRIAFGYRNFDNFKFRILLINQSMIKCVKENSTH